MSIFCVFGLVFREEKQLFPEEILTREGSSSGMRMLDFRKYFFRKLLSSIPEEVVPELFSGTTFGNEP